MRIKIFILFISVPILYFLSGCFTNGNAHAVLDDEFFNKSRVEQLETCQSCHQELYANFVKGPHYNAYTNYLDHTDYVNEDHFQPVEYQGFVNQMSDNCLSCHASENLFGTVFPLSEDSVPAFIESLESKHYLLPPARTDESSLITGIDCITCHVGGNNIYGSLDVNTSSPGSCEPIGSSIIASNISCLPCHFESVKSEVHGDFSKALSSNSCSSSCHQEYENGLPNHYYNWSFDPEGSANEEWEELFSGISIASKGNDSVAFTWENKNYPHEMSTCVEIVSYLDFYSDGGISESDTIRINRKDFHDETVLSRCFPDTTPPGIFGFHLPKINDSLVVNYGQNSKIDSVQLKVAFKQQYWLHDSIGKVLHENTMIP